MLKAAIAAGVLVRLALIATAALLRGEAAFRVNDTRAYLALASNLLTHGAFAEVAGQPELFRTPGYPLVLVPGVALDAVIPWALATNLLFTIAIILATWWVARRLLDERKAGLCALVVAIEPTLLTWSLKVMPETLLALCLLLFVGAALRALETREPRWMVAAGIAICAAAYVKPIAYPLVFVVCALAFFVRPKQALVLFALCAALLGAWHVRNYAATGFAGFTTLIDRAVYLSAGGSVAAERANVPYAEMRRRMLERSDVRGTPDPAKQARIRREGLSLVQSDPLGYAKTHAAGMLRTLFDPGAAEYLRILGLYDAGARTSPRAYPLVLWSSVALGIVLLPLVVLPVVALVRLRRNAGAAFFLPALVTAYLVTAGGGVPGNYRFRAPAVPLLVLMSACAFRLHSNDRCHS